MIREGDKIKLKTGKIALVAEVLAENEAYIADIFDDKSGGISVEQILHAEIASVFVEIEQPVNAV